MWDICSSDDAPNPPMMSTAGLSLAAGLLPPSWTAMRKVEVGEGEGEGESESGGGGGVNIALCVCALLCVGVSASLGCTERRMDVDVGDGRWPVVRAAGSAQGQGQGPPIPSARSKCLVRMYATAGVSNLESDSLRLGAWRQEHERRQRPGNWATRAISAVATSRFM